MAAPDAARSADLPPLPLVAVVALMGARTVVVDLLIPAGQGGGGRADACWLPPKPRAYICTGCGDRLPVESGGIAWVNDDPYCHPLWPQIGIKSCYERATNCPCRQYRPAHLCDCDEP